MSAAAGSADGRRALIIEDGREAYIAAAARALAAAGWAVGLAGPSPNVRATRSRAVVGWHEVPAPSEGIDQFADAAAVAVRDGRYDLVFGGDDIEVLAVSATRDRLGAIVPYAPHDRVVAAIDKLELTTAAAATGLSVPATRPASPDAVASTPLPVVVKARLHWTPGGAGPGRYTVRIVCDRQQLREHVAAMQLLGAQPLLQAPVEGRLGALSLVVGRSGEVLASVQQVAREISLSGVSARATTVPVDRALVSRAHALLLELDWHGLANLQFLTPDGGSPQLIDCNGRFYGSLALAVAAGANLPAIWAADALGLAAPAPVTGRPGVRYQSFPADLLRARRAPRRDRMREVAGTVAFAFGAAHSTWRREDPLPLVGWLSHRAAGRLGEQAVRCRTVLRNALTTRRGSPRVGPTAAGPEAAGYAAGKTIAANAGRRSDASAGEA